MAYKNWVLDTPPRLCQLKIYKGDEAPMACWATSAEMAVKWKGGSQVFVRPTFRPPSTENSDAGMDDRIRYQLEIEGWFRKWTFEPQNSGSYGTWTAETISTILKEKGPLVCLGSFGLTPNPLAIGGPAHAICIYGYAGEFGGVYYVDPWDGLAKQMTLNAFRDKLSKSTRSVYSRIPNYRS